MEIHKINNNDNNSFQRGMHERRTVHKAVKNTYARQRSLITADYLEAVARLHNIKFLQAKNELNQTLDKVTKPYVILKETWHLIKTFSSMIYHEWVSNDYFADSQYYRHRLDNDVLNNYRK